MESWRIVWRDGFVPNLSDNAIVALHAALKRDDVRLVQGATCSPPPLVCTQDRPVEAACLLGICGWIGDGLKTVGEVEHYFARQCFDADQLLGEPAACRWLLNWYDDSPRHEVIRELLGEVDIVMQSRLIGPYTPVPS